ncbi:MAG TPA: FAD-dependent oxidoreductase [Casimicrobiaceae bacterium]|nr:FAD-dependent oxidoreductase [Casimicrobiaceae bacterium]
MSGVDGDAESGLTTVSWRDRRTNAEETRSTRNLFLFIGADPETEGLKRCGVAFDTNGFVLTGHDCSTADGVPTALASNIPGVFAVGDVRSGSVKPVGGAIGEGAAVVPSIHSYLTGAR